MFCWGNMRNGELGLGGLEEDVVTFPRASTFHFADEITEIGCGDNHTILVLRDGEVYSCGSNDFGQLGHEKPRTRPEKIDKLDAQTIIHVACGSHHTLALNKWGEVFAWGSNSNGQLGLNIAELVNLAPTMIKLLATKQVVQIACGRSHSLALTNVGELYAWGANNNGQLGLGSAGATEFKPCPIKALQGVPISHIACGADFSFAVCCSGAVYAWGKNSSGQLGLGDTIDRAHPTQLKSLRFQRVTYVACGMDHTVALTKEGGVFTFGAGVYGQLGHGSKANEMLPRMVLELMGSTVTQIACGRYHTLAYVPSCGRMYAFGMGTSGQLGGSTTSIANSPLLVQGPWVGRTGTPNGASPSSGDRMEVDHPSDSLAICQRLLVMKIFAGGDQSFALVSPDREGIETFDYREKPSSTQILTINQDEVKKLRLLNPEEPADLELLRYVETVFSQLACYNASFLRADGSHYGCSAKNHGLDLERAAETFAQISRIEHPTVCDLLRKCIVSDLFASLPVLPPDVEVLRVHLILPLYHEFSIAKNYEELQCPFANTVINMKLEVRKIYESWLSLTSTDYFVRLINIYKQTVLHILNTPSNGECTATIIRLGNSLKACLDFLKIVNSVNRQASNPKVGHEQFYIPELADMVDIKTDYFKWIFNSPNHKEELRLCNYSFLFDAKAKTLLLEADQALQMKKAMNEPNGYIFGLVPVVVQQYLVLEVRRNNIANDTITQLGRSSAADLKKPLKVKFHGEEAEDAGGVRKEFFMLLLKEILDPKYGMFTHHEETRAIWFSEASLEEESMYFLIGLLCGLAIYNFTIINLPFPLVLYKKLLGEEVQLDDLAGLTPTLLRSFHSLLEYEEDDLEDVFCLNFIVSREMFGAVKTDELKPGGANIPVTQSNKQEYVDLYVDFLLNKSVNRAFTAFAKGFHKVCGGRVLGLFQAHELMDLVVGNENYDWRTLQENCEYKNGFSADHQTIKLFWEVFHDLDHEQKKRFLLFLTGSDRIPILGMKAVKIIIQRVGSSDSHLPVAHTCFNVLDLPVYHTKEKLRYKLLQAIQQTQGFALA